MPGDNIATFYCSITNMNTFKPAARNAMITIIAARRIAIKPNAKMITNNP